MGVDYKNEERMLKLKYKLKTELEELIHMNIMEEINKNIEIKRREERRGIK